MGATIHASAVLLGARAVLIRGPSGCGKSRLAAALLAAPQIGAGGFTRLVADDRVDLAAHHGRLIARPPPALAGLLEVHGLGIRRVPYEGAAVVGWVVELAAADAARLPDAGSEGTRIAGVALPRLAVASGQDAFPLLVGMLTWPCSLP